MAQILHVRAGVSVRRVVGETYVREKKSESGRQDGVRMDWHMYEFTHARAYVCCIFVCACIFGCV